MKYCYKCGEQLKDTDKFCKACGTEQKNLLIDNGSESSKPNNVANNNQDGDIQKDELSDNKNLQLNSVSDDKRHNTYILIGVVVAVCVIICTMGVLFVRSNMVDNKNEVVEEVTTTEITEEKSEENIVEITENTTESLQQESSENENYDWEYEDIVVDGEDKYYYGTAYATPNWYKDNMVVISGYEVLVSTGDVVWKNAKVPSAYWFNFQEQFGMMSWCLYFSTENEAHAVCIQLAEHFNDDGVNVFGYKRDEAMYYYLENVLIIDIPGKEFEDIFQKDFYEITENDVIEYFSDNMDVIYNLREDQVRYAVINYCIDQNPDLEKMIDDDNYTIDWDIEEQDDDTYIVTYRSYTGAYIYYHVNKYTGETTSTEFVPGITDGEQEGTEHFNVNDYLD